MMDKKEDFKTGNEILVENPYGGGCYSITILQNWRGILKISIIRTSGSRASDVWSEEEIQHITDNKLCEILNEEFINPYGWDVSVIKSKSF